MIKIDVEGAEKELLLGAGRTLSRTPAPLWLVEINLTEHHPSGLNPHFRDVFDLFWGHDYVAQTADDERRVVRPDDVDRWIAAACRDFGTINYIFEKTAT